MALNYIFIGVSSIIFIFYLMGIFLALKIRKKLNKNAGVSFIYLALAIVLLAIRRVQQIFLKAEIMEDITYFTDVIVFLVSILLFLAILTFYRAIKKVGSPHVSTGESFKNYKRNLGIRIK